MITSINSLSAIKEGVKTPGLKPELADVADFKAMMNQANPVNDSIKSFVSNAEEKLKISNTSIQTQLRQFNAKDSVMSLIEATYTSSMKAVSIQMTGQIGSKVSGSFEQLIKQQ